MCKSYVSTGKGDNTSFTKEIFDDRDLRSSYSSYLLLEIQDQAQFYYSILEWQQFKDFNDGYLGKLINKRSRDFSFEVFSSAHASFMHDNKKAGKDTPDTFRTAETLIQFMFDLNIIGYKWELEVKDRKTGMKRKIPRTNWSFRQRSFANLKPKAPTGGTYVMHYGVAKALFTDF